MAVVKHGFVSSDACLKGISSAPGRRAWLLSAGCGTGRDMVTVWRQTLFSCVGCTASRRRGGAKDR